VYVSFDDGDHWQPLQNGLPSSSVRDLVVHDNDLVIATHGRAFWALDDVSALRHIELLTDARQKGVVLFPPATAVRLRPAGFTGTPLPQDEPRAPNPPSGAAFDYALASAARGPVVLRILDAGGSEVRKFSSDDPVRPPDLTKLPIAPSWVEPPARLGTTAGMHRFVWPLHTAGSPALGSDSRPDEGLWARPGRYTVELTVDGETRTQPLTVAVDPRVKATAADLAAQAELAQAIQTARIEAAELAKAIATYAKTLPARGGEADATWKALDAITGGEGSRFGRPSAPPARPSLRTVTEDLDNLASAVGEADAAPSPDAQDGFAKARRTLDAIAETWRAFQAAPH